MAEPVGTQAGLTEEQALSERQKYVAAFNKTMIAIWEEKITLLGVIDTGRLLHSPISIQCSADGKVSEVQLTQGFLEYGLWQDFGTGRETPRGNPGDIGRPKVRVPKPWFTKKYYGSVMNLKEFMADSLGREFLGLFAPVKTDYIRYHHGETPWSSGV